MRLLFGIFALLFFLAAQTSQAAWACEGQDGKAVLDDKFADDAGGWLFDNRVLSLAAPGARIYLQAGAGAAIILNRTFDMNAGDFCVETSYTSEALKVNAGFGVIFWAKDLKDLWSAAAFPTGDVMLSHLNEGNWQTVWKTTVPSLFKSSAGATNAMRVIAKDETITVDLNGTTIKSVRAKQPPADATLYFGVYVGPTRKTSTPFSVNLHSFTAME